MSYYEVTLIFAALLMLIVFEKRHGFTIKECGFSLILLLPVLFFSINLLTNAITVDETRYMQLITYIRDIKESDVAEKVLNQYKMSQLITGSVFYSYRRW